MFRPLHDWVLVTLDPIPAQRAGFFIPEESTANTIRTGTVVAIGPGRYGKGSCRQDPDVRCGEKVAFFRWHLEHTTGKRVTTFLEGVGENLALVKVPDILFAYPETTTLEVH